MYLRGVLKVGPMAAMVLLLGAFAVPADDKEPDKLSAWQKLFRKQAGEYSFVIEGEQAGEVRVVPEPVLNWSQPVRGGAEGAVFVWAQAGRPVAIGTFFIWPSDGKQNVAHELHSFSQEPMRATWHGFTWDPPKDSVVWMPMPDAAKPAGRPEQRLRQMRDLAEQFSAESIDHNDRRWDLRLLTRPIYRYALDKSTETGELIDGALFGFVEGTDLEIVLAIQARKDSSGAHWEYALARMSDFRLTAKLGEKIVWQVARAGGANPRANYTCPTVEVRTSAEDK